MTEGPCRSALLAKPFLDPSLPLVVANCDQVMRWNGKRFVDYCMREDYDGVVVTYHENTPKNSYVKLNDVGDVIQVKEKEQISCVSLNGIHFWKKAQYFFDSSFVFEYHFRKTGRHISYSKRAASGYRSSRRFG